MFIFKKAREGEGSRNVLGQEIRRRARIPSGENEWSAERVLGRYLQPGEERPGEEIKPAADGCARTYVCMRSPEFQNCKFFNSRGRDGGGVGGGAATVVARQENTFA